jgi:hypothetical protein
MASVVLFVSGNKNYRYEIINWHGFHANIHKFRPLQGYWGGTGMMT